MSILDNFSKDDVIKLQLILSAITVEELTDLIRKRGEKERTGMSTATFADDMLEIVEIKPEPPAAIQGLGSDDAGGGGAEDEEPDENLQFVVKEEEEEEAKLFSSAEEEVVTITIPDSEPEQEGVAIYTMELDMDNFDVVGNDAATVASRAPEQSSALDSGCGNRNAAESVEPADDLTDLASSAATAGSFTAPESPSSSGYRTDMSIENMRMDLEHPTATASTLTALEKMTPSGNRNGVNVVTSTSNSGKKKRKIGGSLQSSAAQFLPCDSKEDALRIVTGWGDHFHGTTQKQRNYTTQYYYCKVDRKCSSRIRIRIPNYPGAGPVLLETVGTHDHKEEIENEAKKEIPVCMGRRTRKRKICNCSGCATG